MTEQPSTRWFRVSSLSFSCLLIIIIYGFLYSEEEHAFHNSLKVSKDNAVAVMNYITYLRNLLTQLIVSSTFVEVTCILILSRDWTLSYVVIWK